MLCVSFSEAPPGSELNAQEEEVSEDGKDAHCHPIVRMNRTEGKESSLSTTKRVATVLKVELS